METSKFESVVSFRIRKEDKTLLEQIIKEAKSNKSDFVREIIKSLILKKKRIKMKLTEQQIKMITDAGRYRLPAKNLALLLDLPEQEVKAALYDSESEIGKHYQKGKAMLFINTMKALEKKAETGDEHAAKELIRVQKYLIERDAIDDFCGNP